MSKTKTDVSRRRFFKLAGAAGMGSIVASMGKMAGASEGAGKVEPGEVPRRPFGNTGEYVPVLGLGGSQDLMSKQLLLKQAFKMGVTYWDTAHRYEGGASEKAIGKYFTKYPDDRKSIFLVTKSSETEPKRLDESLNTSLERLKTSFVDLFFIHHVTDVKESLTPEVKMWAERAKARGAIRYFGFSTHKNMAQCLMDAAKLGWIDGIMASYNYRLMNTSEMKRAVDACESAGIGLTAMKTQAKFFSYFYADIGRKDAESRKITEHFMARGFTLEQAKLKAVWSNPYIASICSEMPNMTILRANVAASMDRTRLTRRDMGRLDRYARETAFGYCTGCGRICESALDGKIPVSDVMRFLMYDMAYEKSELAARSFKDIPSETRERLRDADFSIAERRCPQGMPITKLVKKAVERFAWYDESKA